MQILSRSVFYEYQGPTPLPLERPITLFDLLMAQVATPDLYPSQNTTSAPHAQAINARFHTD
jgi:hypothetical protein